MLETVEARYKPYPAPEAIESIVAPIFIQFITLLERQSNFLFDSSANKKTERAAITASHSSISPTKGDTAASSNEKRNSI